MFTIFKRNLSILEYAVDWFVYSDDLLNLDFFPPTILGDDKWYRAIILGINESEIKVVYADYGIVEMLPFSSLQPITAPYLQLPFQILKCSLAGNKPTSLVCQTVNIFYSYIVIYVFITLNY